MPRLSASLSHPLDFVCIGAPRAATTTLHQVLARSEHFDVPQFPKETHFFDRHYGRGYQWYDRHFTGARGRRRGEIAPSYMRDATAARRLQEYNPSLRIVVLLRHPVSRTISHFAYMRHHFGVVRTLEESLAIGQEPLDSSRYAGHLRRFVELFGRDRVRVLLFERFITDPQTVMESLSRWLGVPAVSVGAKLPQVNAVKVPRAHSVWGFARRVRHQLYAWDLPVLVRWAKRARLHNLLANPRRPVLSRSDFAPQALELLFNILRPEVLQLSALLSFNFSAVWDMRPPSHISD